MSSQVPTIVEVLDETKRYAELPINERPKECPLNETQRKEFIQKYGKSLHSCPAFGNNKCPFDDVKSVQDIHEKVQHAPNVEKCPAFDHHHGELMEILYPDVHRK